MPVRPLMLTLLGLSLCLPAAAGAQQPLIDAGQQAMIQHYNNLIEQQSAPDQEEAADAARKRNGRAEPQANERCDVDAVRARLRPEYERRARVDGRAAASAWLRQQGEEAGRYAARNC